jgi:hypothetical protein
MPDLLDETHREITDRLKQLSQFVEEHRRLQAALKALDGIGRSTAVSVATRGRKPGRARSAAKPVTATPTKTPGPPEESATEPEAPKATATASTPRRVGRRKGSGTRTAEALAHVEEQPGITIAELAAKMGIKHNYLYRVLPALQKERKVYKQGKGWHPRSS